MFMVDENDADNQCFIKAKAKNEPTFTLRAQDESAAEVIAIWLAMNKQLSDEKKKQTLVRIQQFKNWPTKKKAD